MKDKIMLAFEYIPIINFLLLQYRKLRLDLIEKGVIRL